MSWSERLCPATSVTALHQIFYYLFCADACAWCICCRGLPVRSHTSRAGIIHFAHGGQFQKTQLAQGVKIRGVRAPTMGVKGKGVEE